MTPIALPGAFGRALARLHARYLARRVRKLLARHPETLILDDSLRAVGDPDRTRLAVMFDADGRPLRVQAHHAGRLAWDSLMFDTPAARARLTRLWPEMVAEIDAHPHDPDLTRIPEIEPPLVPPLDEPSAHNS